jgi:hypothetical protein
MVWDLGLLSVDHVFGQVRSAWCLNLAAQEGLVLSDVGGVRSVNSIYS